LNLSTISKTINKNYNSAETLNPLDENDSTSITPHSQNKFKKEMVSVRSLIDNS